MDMYKIESLNFAYKGNRSGLKALSGLSLSIKQKERWAIIGPSGCGKSTLLKLLDGLLLPTSGSIYYKEERLSSPPADIAFVLQNYGLFPWKTIAENLALPLKLKGFSKKQIPLKIETLLSHLNLSGYEKAYPQELSGGQQQRIALGRALIAEPEVLLLDEPFSALDALTREKLQELTLELCLENELTAILVTHSIEEAVFFADHILLFNRQSPKIFTNPNSGQADYRDSLPFSQLVHEIRSELKEAGNL